MSNATHIYLDGPVVAKGRPRFGKGKAYTPDKTRAYETALTLAAKAAHTGKPFTGPVWVSMRVWIVPPKSWSDKKRGKAMGHPVPVKPDLDNYIKLLDALEKVVFKNDSQVVSLEASKRYGTKSGLVITVEPT